MNRQRRTQIEQEAEKLLSASKAFRIPVAIDRVAQHKKLRTTATDLGKDISGVLVIEKKRAAIGYNINHPPVRQRFTIAHEIGHYILHAKNSSNSKLFVDYIAYRRDDLRPTESNQTGADKQEVEANAFAAALLMPEKLVRREIEKHNFDLEDDKDLNALAKLFDVSTIAMSIRLANLALLPKVILSS
jgi:Zn-dependent peptidase ImmA (M78 family)